MSLSIPKWSNGSSAFLDDIPGCLQPGMVIFIQGIIPPGATREAINFKSGDDIALHINPRFNENRMLLNTYSSNEWGTEETKTLPFRKMEIYEVVIAVLDSHFKISVNGEHFENYNHQIPYSDVSVLEISTGFGLHFIRYDLKGCVKFRHDLTKAIPLPICEKIYERPRYGNVIFMSGRVHGHDGFTFNIQRSIDSSKCDIALHFTTRGSTLITNHRSNGQWGSEEHTENPLRSNQDFQIMIAYDCDAFQVAVNNKHKVRFVYRQDDVLCFPYLVVNGNVSIHPVQYYDSLQGFKSV